MRLTPLLIPALIAACNTTPATTVTDTESATGGGSSSGTTQGSSPTTGVSATEGSTDAPTGGSEGMTDSGTTIATATSTSTSSTTGTETGTTSPAQTDTGPQETSGTSGVETTDGTSSGDGSSSGSSGGESSTGDVEACACPDLEVALDDGIFVLSTAQLWKYFPETNKLEQLGAIDCDLPPSTFSMAVDRLGFAWVQFLDLQLRKVDVTNVANCSDPGFVPGQQGVRTSAWPSCRTAPSTSATRSTATTTTASPRAWTPRLLPRRPDDPAARQARQDATTAPPR
jgi:hypothetical protein